MSFTDLLGDDIFLEIFDYLNEKDLKICEEVCVRWNCLVKFISTPIRVYERKMRSSIMWQKYVKIRAKHQVLPQTRYPRLQIAREVKLLDENWQTWSYQLRIYPLDGKPRRLRFPYRHFSMDDDYFFWVHPMMFGDSCTVIDRKTMAVKCGDGDSFFQTPSSTSSFVAKIHNNMVIALCQDSIKFLDVNTGQQIREIPERIAHCCFGNLELFLLYSKRKLRIWRMNSALDMTFIRHMRFPSYRRDGFTEMSYPQLDDEYIAVFIRTESGTCESEGWWTVYFVSTKTFQVERSLSVALKYGYEPRYERGFLVLQSRYFVRLVHIASGKCTSVIDVTGRGRLDDCLVTSNSRYLVTWEIFDQESVKVDKMLGAKLNLFDLQSLRNISCPCTAPLSEHIVPFVPESCQVDETQLVFTSSSNHGELAQLYVFDFAPGERDIDIVT